jgi:23S rRNA G2445 N2-methylase RlmL
MPARQGRTRERPRRGGPSTGGSNPPSGTRFLGFAVPGLGPVLAEELAALPGVRVEDSGFDGRADVVLFTATSPAVPGLLAVTTAEDIVVEVGRTLRRDGDRAPWIAGRLWRPDRTRRALGVVTSMGRQVRDRPTYRVVARVLQERSFLRTELRRQVTGVIDRLQAGWRFADPAAVEVWVVEYQPGRIVAGIRVSDARMRQHDGRATERVGALRPTVAAAMVRLAGPPGGNDDRDGGVLLDPCCGSGTILAEARQAGWRACGVDIEASAVGAARRNAPGARVAEGDARRLDVEAGSVGAVVSNLPFGRQFQVPGGTESWLRAVLGELARVVRPGGRVVLLVPELPRAAVPPRWRLTRSVRVQLLGTRATIWVLNA